MKIFISACLLLVLFLSNVFAQEEKKPKVTFNNGVGIIHPDSLFSLNFRFRLQARAAFTTYSGENLEIESVEARIRRMRLRFAGFMLSPRLTYYIQLSFSRGDMDWNGIDNSVYNSSPNVVRDAVLNYKFSKRFTLGFGQTKLPGNRQRKVSSGELQFPDRALTNAIYTVDRDFGLFGTYNGEISSMVYLLKGAVSTGEGRNSLISDNGLAYTGRVEFLPFGAFTNKGDYFEGDLEREQTPKLSIAGGYSYNAKARRTRGTTGSDLYESRDLESILIDMVFKYYGWAFSSEYLTRNTDNPITTNNDGEIRTAVIGRGNLFQTSYIFRNNFEIAGRYAVSVPNKKVYSYQPQLEEVAIGATKYLRKHRVKLQFDLTYGMTTNKETDTTADYWRPRFQVELGI